MIVFNNHTLLAIRRSACESWRPEEFLQLLYTGISANEILRIYTFINSFIGYSERFFRFDYNTGQFRLKTILNKHQMDEFKPTVYLHVKSARIIGPQQFCFQFRDDHFDDLFFVQEVDFVFRRVYIDINRIRVQFET